MKRWRVILCVLLCAGLVFGGWVLYENREPDEGLLRELVVENGAVRSCKKYYDAGGLAWHWNRKPDERTLEKLTTKDGIIREYSSYLSAGEQEVTAEDLTWDQEKETRLTVSYELFDGPSEVEVEVLCQSSQSSNWASCGTAVLSVGGEGASFIIPAHSVYRVEAAPAQGQNGYAHIWCTLELLPISVPEEVEIPSSEDFENYYNISEDTWETVVENPGWNKDYDTVLTTALVKTDGPTKCQVEVSCKAEGAEEWRTCSTGTIELGGDAASFAIPANLGYRVRAKGIDGKSGSAAIRVSRK